MIKILIYFFIAISLSIDAFSLSLSISSLLPSSKEKNILSLTIGFFHFIMPLLGSYFGIVVSQKITSGTNILSSIIFIILAFEMYYNKNHPEEMKKINIINILIISLIVSIDSLSVGIALGVNKESIIQASIIFMSTSFTFTKIGLSLGKRIEAKSKTHATWLGIILLLIIALKYYISG